MKLLCALVFASLSGPACGAVADRPVVRMADTTVAPMVAPAPAAPLAARPDSVYVPILVYHGVFPHHPGQTPDQIEYDVSPENFETQMAYLKDNGYHVISLVSLVDALTNGDTVPAKSVVITLDDGMINQYVHAFPILKKYGLRRRSLCILIRSSRDIRSS